MQLETIRFGMRSQTVELPELEDSNIVSDIFKEVFQVAIR
jgi:hypothetical protein